MQPMYNKVCEIKNKLDICKIIQRFTAEILHNNISLIVKYNQSFSIIPLKLAKRKNGEKSYFPLPYLELTLKAAQKSQRMTLI